ncbi:DNA polymerase III, delta subunit [Magnetococcus marinus MC-1]|uniref:DNA polymerase III subunit delta n=1 Tax=Magnetococcus marinus (strain ATCC BAA-1437 / JCM 17883 / MC-1) TaxID=156889 RepID=A0LD22_MAGMM|nr:DNA polymerase III subunit delta [Magnetococcus marinus]ABK45865.1 DNA polymerase III, delta subunit [Magnetococcus marinus MC-1]
MKLKDRELLGKLKGKHYPLVILLYGQEQGRIEDAAKKIEQWVLGPDADADFDLERFYGGDLDEGRFLSSCRAIPFLSPMRLVVVKEADKLLLPLRKSFLSYLENEPSKSSVVLFLADNLDASHTLRKGLEKHEQSWVVPFYALAGREMGGWIEEHLRCHGFSAAEPDLIPLLVQLLEGDTRSAEQELEKLFLYVGKPGPIRLEDARAIVGEAALHSGFDLADAVLRGDAAKALHTLDGLVQAGGMSEALPLLGLITQRIRRLAQAQGWMQRGMSGDEVTRKLRIFWKEKDHFLAQCRQVSAKHLAEGLITCQNADRQLKGAEGARPPEQVLGIMILRLARLFGGRP